MVNKKVIALLTALVSLAITSLSNLAVADPGGSDGRNAGFYEVTQEYRFVIDGRECQMPMVLMVKNRVYVPLRKFSECLGLTVSWLEQQGVAQVTYANPHAGDGNPSHPARIDMFFRPKHRDPRVEYFESSPVSPLLPTRSTATFNMQDGAPFIYYVPGEGERTFLPFRFVTEGVNFNVKWAPANETSSKMNEVRVTKGLYAVPSDGYTISPEHVQIVDGVYPELRLRAQPDTGWPFYPATWRALKEITWQVNWAVREVKRDLGAAAEITVDRTKLRVRVHVVNTERDRMVDYYGTHWVRWFRDEDEALAYKGDLGLNTAGTTFLGVGVTAGSAYLGTVLAGGALGGPIGAGGALLTGWMVYVDAVKAQEFESCFERAKLDQWKPLRQSSDPALFGQVYSMQGAYCLPVYKDGVIGERGQVDGQFVF